MSDLFGSDAAHGVFEPLAARLRPQTLNDVVGQSHLVGEDGVLRRLLRGGTLGSLIFWGPPGTGKTTVARLLAQHTHLAWVELSAVFAGVSDLRKVFDEARQRRHHGQGILLFVDEIHRFNKSQQDALLPVLEDGTIVLVGATTENPSFSLVSPLLSRARVLVFHPLSLDELMHLAVRAEEHFQGRFCLDAKARTLLVSLADGDGRALLTLFDDLARLAPEGIVDDTLLEQLLQRRAPQHDRDGDGHYNLISALHKCVRGSDPDAALYYLARMLDGGEDANFIARRLIRMAVEDIGLADPHALTLAVSAAQAYAMLGSPEGDLALQQVAVYLALAPKSNAVYKAAKSSMHVAQEWGSVRPPLLVLNAPSRFMKQQGYGRGYRYDHHEPDAFSGQNYWPDGKEPQVFYEPTDYGRETNFGQRLSALRAERKGKGAQDA